ncbi:MAG: tetratricopeptide repeat-containing glycosyltransferase family protein [Pseudomonadota bacterium]
MGKGNTEAVAEAQSDLSALFYQGLALHQQGKLGQAQAIYKQVLARQPRHFDAMYFSGAIAAQSGNHLIAAELIGKAIAIDPRNAEAHMNLGNALRELGRLEEALASYETAIAIKPGHAGANSNRAIALRDSGHLQEALAGNEKAIAATPDCASEYSNRGLVLQELKRMDEAFASYDRAIAIKPDFVEAFWNKSLALLQSGEFKHGWQLYERRWEHQKLGLKARKFPQPLWLGVQDIAGKTLLLHAEQGLGDTIQFCRYAGLVKEKGAKVVLEVPKALFGLLGRLDGVDELVEQGKTLPAFDFHCPLLSLPLAFKTDLTSIPSPEAYLAATADKCQEWSQRLGPKTKRRVGFVWSGSAVHKNNHNRSLTVQQLLRHMPECHEYVSLQKEARDADRHILAGRGIVFHGEGLKDFTDTAALCALMDVVISVDTSVAHLAGALGKETWILLPYSPDWRWLLERQDSPWYRSVKLFRQAADVQWEPVLERVADELHELA